jgi:hypothetical protein
LLSVGFGAGDNLATCRRAISFRRFTAFSGSRIDALR